jgi:hypothetical protein
MPEVPNNIDMTLGNLGLTGRQENQIVAFIETLTDGHTTPYPDRNTFTGQCMKGGSAATQGNASIVPAPTPLPPCASAICSVTPLPGPHPISYGGADHQFATLLKNGPGARMPSAAALGNSLPPDPAAAQMYNRYQATRPLAKKAAQVAILQGPALEFARDDLAIIRWTTNNP